MITELKSVRDVWKKMPTERHARLFLENAIWGDDRFCPHCGSLSSRPLRGVSVRPGLYQCIERECRRQFTVTTRTPLHATKLDLRTWIAAMFLVLTSFKGISSVVTARILGEDQKTAWKLGHLDDYKGDTPGGDLTALVALIRRVCGLDQTLTRHSDRVRRNFQNWILKRHSGAGEKFTEAQMTWLRMIRDHLATSFTIERDDLEMSPFDGKGGLGQMYALFGDGMEDIVTEMNEALSA